MYQTNSNRSSRAKNPVFTIGEYLEIVKDKSNQLYNKLPRREKKQVDALRALQFLKIKSYSSGDFSRNLN